MGEPNCNNRRQRAALPTHTVESSFDQNPPEYSTIISAATTSNHEHADQLDTSTMDSNEFGPRVLFNSETYRHQIVNTRRHTTTNFPSQKSLEKMDSFSLTMPRRQAAVISSTTPNERCNFRNLTAQDVAQLLRSRQNQQSSMDDHMLADTLAPNSIDSTTFTIDSNDHNTDIGQEQEDYSLTRSVEELVLNEVPIGESSAAATLCDK